MYVNWGIVRVGERTVEGRLLSFQQNTVMRTFEGMHLAVKRFIKDVRKELPYKFRLKRVLEVGSKNINGSPRKYFWFCNYTGVDLSAGKGVDEIGFIHELRHTKDLTGFDVCISTECLEHDVYWRETLTDMFRRLKAGGLMIITCAGIERQEHGTRRTTPFASPDTLDYYRNISKEDFKSVLPCELFDLYVLMNGRDKQDLYFYGIKKYKL